MHFLGSTKQYDLLNLQKIIFFIKKFSNIEKEDKLNRKKNLLLTCKHSLQLNKKRKLKILQYKLFDELKGLSSLTDQQILPNK